MSQLKRKIQINEEQVELNENSKCLKVDGSSTFYSNEGILVERICDGFFLKIQDLDVISFRKNFLNFILTRKSFLVSMKKKFLNDKIVIGWNYGLNRCLNNWGILFNFELIGTKEKLENNSNEFLKELRQLTIEYVYPGCINFIVKKCQNLEKLVLISLRDERDLESISKEVKTLSSLKNLKSFVSGNSVFSKFNMKNIRDLRTSCSPTTLFGVENIQRLTIYDVNLPTCFPLGIQPNILCSIPIGKNSHGDFKSLHTLEIQGKFPCSNIFKEFPSLKRIILSYDNTTDLRDLFDYEVISIPTFEPKILQLGGKTIDINNIAKIKKIQKGMDVFFNFTNGDDEEDYSIEKDLEKMKAIKNWENIQCLTITPDFSNIPPRILNHDNFPNLIKLHAISSLKGANLPNLIYLDHRDLGEMRPDFSPFPKLEVISTNLQDIMNFDQNAPGFDDGDYETPLDLVVVEKIRTLKNLKKIIIYGYSETNIDRLHELQLLLRNQTLDFQPDNEDL